MLSRERWWRGGWQWGRCPRPPEEHPRWPPDLGKRGSGPGGALEGGCDQLGRKKATVGLVEDGAGGLDEDRVVAPWALPEGSRDRS